MKWSEMENKAIWIVDDDRDDHEIIKDIFSENGIEYPLEFFHGAKPLLEKLQGVKVAPFIILCDVNLPGIDGFELRDKMLKTPDKRFHSVPFIFWSGYASEQQIEKAFKLQGHGFFIKESTIEEWTQTLLGIIRYWEKSKAPAKHAAYDEPLK